MLYMVLLPLSNAHLHLNYLTRERTYLKHIYVCESILICVCVFCFCVLVLGMGPRLHIDMHKCSTTELFQPGNTFKLVFLDKKFQGVEGKVVCRMSGVG